MTSSTKSNTLATPVVLPGNVNILKNLVYGGTAGFVGSLMTFPIDCAKTRLQEQVKVTPGTVSPFKGGPYNGIFHCIRTMIRYEGPLAPYRGLPVQAIGIIPEKALKLSINDALRYRFREADGKIQLLWEGAAGGLAGFCQVIVTCPMEMYKIRMQLQNKKPIEQRQTATQVARQLLSGGLQSVYAGTAPTVRLSLDAACVCDNPLLQLLRDVTFSVIYFPLYSNLKLFFAEQRSDHPVWGYMRHANSDALVDANKRVNLLGAFTAGCVAGSTSAVIVTPFDVIKTRLQSEGGKAIYKNVATCARMTYAEDGVKAFFKGATGRLILIGPLFGIVLFTYELMPQIVPL